MLRFRDGCEFLTRPVVVADILHGAFDAGVRISPGRSVPVRIDRRLDRQRRRRDVRTASLTFRPVSHLSIRNCVNVMWLVRPLQVGGTTATLAVSLFCNPCRDLGPGGEAEFGEDVFDVSLRGSR